MADEEIQWATSEGGPLIAIEAGNLRHWQGIDAPTDGRIVEATFRWNDPNDPASDYDRACDVSDHAALLVVGDGTGLVLGDSPDATTWWPRSDSSGGILVRWHYAEDEGDVEKYMLVVPDLPTEEAIVEWTVTDTTIYLFDSAFSGDNVLEGLSNDYLTFELKPGRYVVSTSIYRPNDLTHFVLHRIEYRVEAAVLGAGQ